MAKKEILSEKTPQELYQQITQNNPLARCKEGTVREEAHKTCKAAIEELIKRNYGKVSATFEAMVDAGTGIGSEACIDVFKYAQAQKDERSETTEEIETKYGTNYHGCAMCGVIDPNKITQLK